MALAITHRVHCHLTTNVTTYATDSGGAAGLYTPAANSLLIAVVVVSAASLVETPAVSGHGISYTKLTTGISDASAQRMSVWVADSGSSPTSAAVTASGWGSGRTGCHIMEAEITGADLSGGAVAAIVQVVTGGPGTATSGSTTTMSAAGHADNRAMSAYHHIANEATTPRSSPSAWTELNDGNYASPSSGAEYQYRSDAFETGTSASWTTSSLWIGMAWEVKASVAAGGADATPSVIAAVAAVPTPATKADAGATPSVITAAATTPGPAAKADANASPGTVSAIASVPTPTIVVPGPANATPATITAVASVPTPTITSSGTATPARVAAQATVPTPAVTANANATPARIAAVAAVPTPTVSGTATATPAKVSAVAAVPTPSVVAGGAATATPNKVSAVAAVPTPTITSSATATPATISAIAAVPTPAVIAGGGANATPAKVSAVAAVPTPTINISAGATATPARIAAVAAIPTPSTKAEATPTPARIAAQAAIATPTIRITATATPAKISAVAAVPTPSIILGTPGVPVPGPTRTTVLVGANDTDPLKVPNRAVLIGAGRNSMEVP